MQNSTTEFLMKRYAIWDHNRQRFLDLNQPKWDGLESVQASGMNEVEEIYDWIVKNQPNRKVYIIDWEIEDDPV